MAFVTKEIASKGLVIYSAFDDRPFDGYGYSKGIITDVFEDHYLFTDVDKNIENIWGDYDDECSVRNFTSEMEAKNWLRR